MPRPLPPQPIRAICGRSFGEESGAGLSWDTHSWTNQAGKIAAAALLVKKERRSLRPANRVGSLIIAPQSEEVFGRLSPDLLTSGLGQYSTRHSTAIHWIPKGASKRLTLS